MSETTIQWTHPEGYRGESWNPVRGCSRTVAKGAGGRSECGDATGGGCYAERQGARGSGPGGAYDGLVRLTGKGPRWTGKVITVEHRLYDPVRARAPRCYFVASTSDPFHAEVDDATRDQIFASMALAPRHRYILLTKHGADNGSLRRYMLDPSTPGRIAAVMDAIGRSGLGRVDAPALAADVRSGKRWPIPGLILGVSAGLQAAIDARVPELLAVPAWRRVVSYEPGLEAVDLWPMLIPHMNRGEDREALHWIIVGGESGPRSRPFDLLWADKVATACAVAGVPYFFKQAGRTPVFDGKALPMLIDSHGGDLDELRPVLVDRLPHDFPIDHLLRRNYPDLEI